MSVSFSRKTKWNIHKSTYIWIGVDMSYYVTVKGGEIKCVQIEMVENGDFTSSLIYRRRMD